MDYTIAYPHWSMLKGEAHNTSCLLKSHMRPTYDAFGNNDLNTPKILPVGGYRVSIQSLGRG